MSNCVDTTTCYPCSNQTPCTEGCLHEHSTDCIQYLDENLDNIDVQTGDYLTDILKKLNNITFSETDFIPTTTDTILATAGGIHGHSPLYDVKLDPLDNLITKSSTGLKVSLSQVLSGKVKVNASDSLDYLEDQLSSGVDLNNIVTVTPVTIGGKIYLVPSLNKTNLLDWIKDELCNLVAGCVPATSSTTSTTSTSTTSTSTTSTSTTSTTTTQPPSEFRLTNLAGQGIFDVSLRDEVSLINYIFNNTTNNGQSYFTTYTGTTNESEIVVQKGGNVPVGINVKVNGNVVYNNVLYIGSVTIQNLQAKSEIEVILYPYAGTTTSTTTTTSTSTSTSSTTFACATYSITNTTGSSKSLQYINCSGTNVIGSIGNGVTVEICARQGSVVVGLGVSVTQTNVICSTTTTAPACKTYDLSNPLNTGPNLNYTYVDCTGLVVSGSLAPLTTIQICAYENSIIGVGLTSVEVGSGCLTTTTSTTTTSTTTTTSSTTSTTTSSTTTTSPNVFQIYNGAKLSSGTPNSSEILAGISTMQNAFLDITCDWTSFNASPQYCWFALPDALGGTSIKNYWLDNNNIANNGHIGDPPDLFGPYSIVNVSGVPYKVWVTQYATQFTSNSISLKNAP